MISLEFLPPRPSATPPESGGEEFSVVDFIQLKFQIFFTGPNF